MPESAAGGAAENASFLARDPNAPNRCPWCSAPAPADATHCPSCHASLAERDSIGDVLIPGVTAVDPAVARRGEVLKTVMAIPGAKLFPTIGFGLAMAASIQQGAERRAEAKRPLGDLGVPSAEALQLAAQLDRSGATAPDPEAGAEPDTATPAPEPAPIVDAWANVPWAGTGPHEVSAAGAVEAAEPIEPEQAEPVPAEREPWEDPALAAGQASPADPYGESPSNQAGQPRD